MTHWHTRITHCAWTRAVLLLCGGYNGNGAGEPDVVMMWNDDQGQPKAGVWLSTTKQDSTYEFSKSVSWDRNDPHNSDQVTKTCADAVDVQVKK